MRPPFDPASTVTQTCFDFNSVLCYKHCL